MKRFSGIVIALCMLLPLSAIADEGMWLVNLFEKSIYPQMKRQGLKLQPGEIYNEQNPALCSAVVAVDYGMGSGSLISDQGLMITNHHVAYGDIHDQSTPERNLLENGFWALSREEELPIKGKTVMFLRKIIDVTPEATALRDEFIRKGTYTSFSTRKIYGLIEKKYGADTPYEVSCASMWRGEKFLLFYYEVYSDVRLVGAPPEKIGAFGGEQDNWGWPQHKGDFALYRIYGDAQGKPAAYSPANVPIHPTKVLDISTQGVHEGDYAMVLGFPGRTNRYMSSFAVDQKLQIINPIIIEARHKRMEILKKHMEADPAVRLKYSDKYFNLANYADYAKWENICLRRYEVVKIKQEQEKSLQAWIEASPERQAEFGSLLSDLQKGYAARQESVRDKHYYQETWVTPCDVLMTAFRISNLANRMPREKLERVGIADKEFAYSLNMTRRANETYDAPTDKELFREMMRLFTRNVSREKWGDYLNAQYDRYEGNTDALANEAFDQSFCSDFTRFCDFFATPRTAQEILADPMVALSNSVSTSAFSEDVDQADNLSGVDVTKADGLYTHALYTMRATQGIPQSPDANSTLRLTYGKVEAVDPRDAVAYSYRSTINGYMEKYNPNDFEFRVDPKMRALIAQKDWGRWGERGELYVNFITNNDITGGNSGSPVLNGRGQLIGLAFDGNRESMSGDIYFYPKYARTVCVDIRFVMWIIEKYAGAGVLMDEMKLSDRK